MTTPQRPSPLEAIAKEMGEGVVARVKAAIGDLLAPLKKQLKALGDRFDALPAPIDADAIIRPMKDELAEFAKRLDEAPVPKDGDPGKDGEKGADCDMQAVAAMVAEMVDKAAAAIPVPVDGKDGAAGADCDMAAVEAKLADLVEARVAALLDQRVAEAVQKAVEELPPPKDGKDGAAGENGLSAFQIAKDAGFDGSVADWLISLRGKDGTHGLDGRDALPGEPGRDGISFDDVVQFEDEKSFGLRWMKGDKVLSEQRWIKPTLADLDGGTWKPGTHERGTHVTFRGSTWFAKCATAEQPGAGEDWRLVAGKGRDGRDRTERQRGTGDVYRIGKP